ncbi:hypothetical protein Droror1_Dr00011931 [Drosera rotundifolia]
MWMILLRWLFVTEEDIKGLPSSLHEANEIVRGNWLRTIDQHHQEYSGNSTIREILDIGCSVGVSTRFLADKFSLVPRITSCNKSELSMINTDFVNSTPMSELCFFYGANFCSKPCIECIFTFDIMIF